jgi:hypothetical protein
MIGLAGASAIQVRAEAGADPTQRILRDGFEQGGFAREGGLFYKDNPEQRSGHVIFDGAAPYSGAGAVTVIATPSCLPHAVGCSERAEIWERPGCSSPSTARSGTALPCASTIRSRRTIADM